LIYFDSAPHQRGEERALVLDFMNPFVFFSRIAISTIQKRLVLSYMYFTPHAVLPFMLDNTKRTKTIKAGHDEQRDNQEYDIPKFYARERRDERNCAAYLSPALSFKSALNLL